MVIAGDFTSVNGVPRDRVAQLNENGAMDPTFGVGTGSSIVLGVGLNTNLALPNLLGKSVVGGNFTALNGATPITPEQVAACFAALGLDAPKIPTAAEILAELDAQ